jgi:hypothetical protein
MPPRDSNVQVPTTRRRFFSGAATVGATAAVAAALPQLSAERVDAKALPPAPENGGGYSLSEHVKRYYKTTLV